MEQERWKVRMCVIIAVLAAIIVGSIYYLQVVRTTELTEGVLISILGEAGEEVGRHGTE